MAIDSNPRPSRGGPRQDMWPKWMWIAVPVLVVVVVAGLWWAIFSPPATPSKTPVPTATMAVLPSQPTQEPTKFNTLPAQPESTATRQILPLSTFTPTPEQVATPDGEVGSESTEGLVIGATAKISGTGGVGLNMRSGAGTSHARVKTIPEGSTVEIIGGPTDANGYTWWQVRDAAGITGWVVSKYMTQ